MTIRLHRGAGLTHQQRRGPLRAVHPLLQAVVAAIGEVFRVPVDSKQPLLTIISSVTYLASPVARYETDGFTLENHRLLSRFD